LVQQRSKSEIGDSIKIDIKKIIKKKIGSYLDSYEGIQDVDIIGKGGFGVVK